MPQLNVHIPPSSDLLTRIEAAARRLGTTPSALARVVLDVPLESYLLAQVDLRLQEQVYSSRMAAELRHRFSSALPARPFVGEERDAVARSNEAAGDAVDSNQGNEGGEGSGGRKREDAAGVPGGEHAVVPVTGTTPDLERDVRTLAAPTAGTAGTSGAAGTAAGSAREVTAAAGCPAAATAAAGLPAHRATR